MKTKITTLLILVHCLVFSQESYLFEYNYTFKKDTLSNDFLTEKYFTVNSENNILFLGEAEVNLYESRDELSKPVTTGTTIKGFGKNLRPSRLNSLLIENEEGITFLRTYFDKIKIKYNEALTLDWIITGDTLSHNGYKCNVAETTYAGREYRAYFTNSIPIPYGPYIFAGLPGLIIYISDSSQSHIFELSQISKRVFSYDSIDSFISVSKEKFFQIEENYKTDPMSLLLHNNNLNYSRREELRNKLKEKLKHDNNPLELTNE